jgi:hypothetical protein
MGMASNKGSTLYHVLLDHSHCQRLQLESAVTIGSETVFLTKVKSDRGNVVLLQRHDDSIYKFIYLPRYLMRDLLDRSNHGPQTHGDACGMNSGDYRESGQLVEQRHVLTSLPTHSFQHRSLGNHLEACPCKCDYLLGTYHFTTCTFNFVGELSHAMRFDGILEVMTAHCHWV